MKQQTVGAVHTHTHTPYFYRISEQSKDKKILLNNKFTKHNNTCVNIMKKIAEKRTAYFSYKNINKKRIDYYKIRIACPFCCI